MRHGHVLFGLAALVALAAPACGTNSSSDDDSEDDPNCATSGADVFVVGLEHKGTAGLFDFQMMSADPAPPARGNNTWVVQISSMNSGVVGAPTDGLSLVVTPYMPAHGHGTPVVVEVTPTGTTGQYSLSPVNLWMPGVWQTTIEATDSTTGTTSTKDSAVYSFCLPD